MVWFRNEPGYGRAAIDSIPGHGLCRLGLRGLVVHDKIIVGLRLPAKFHRCAGATPGAQFIGLFPGSPFMKALAAVVENTAPVSLCRVSRAGETEQVS